MVCEHLAELEQALLAAGMRETYRGQAWSSNCREWVYFACFLELASLRKRFLFAGCVQDHEHRGTHDGQEVGLVCTQCHDAVMGVHMCSRANYPRFA